MIRHWVYVDDWVLQTPPEAAAPILRHIERALAELAFPLQRATCAYRIPRSQAAAQEVQRTDSIADLDAIIPRSENLTILGMEACRDVATEAIVTDSIPGTTQARIDRATRLAAKVCEMLRVAPPAGAHQAAAAIARHVIAHALDYDAGVLPSSLMLPHAMSIDSAVIAIPLIFDLKPEHFSEHHQTQAQLPTSLEGLPFDLPSRLIPLARAARLMEAGPSLRAAIAAGAAAEETHGHSQVRRHGGRRTTSPALP